MTSKLKVSDIRQFRAYGEKKKIKNHIHDKRKNGELRYSGKTFELRSLFYTMRKNN